MIDAHLYFLIFFIDFFANLNVYYLSNFYLIIIRAEGFSNLNKEYLFSTNKYRNALAITEKEPTTGLIDIIDRVLFLSNFQVASNFGFYFFFFLCKKDPFFIYFPFTKNFWNRRRSI